MSDEDNIDSSPTVSDPYSGPHEESIHAMWHDPSAYDPIKHGPPYLPEKKIKTASATNAKEVKDTARPLVQKMATDELTEILAVIEHIQADYGDAVPMREMAALLAFVQAEATIHQSHHWQTRGEPFYGDHLLFERVYNEVFSEIDKLAERMVGSGHHILAHPILLAKHCSLVVQSFYRDAGANPSSDTYPTLSLRATLRTLVALKVVYAALEKKGTLSHGIDNLLQDIADQHESHVYLLKQRAQAKTASSYDRRASVEVGMEFPTIDALKKYMHLHPKADPANHSVEEKDDEDLGAGEWGSGDDPNLEHDGWVEKEASLKWKQSPEQSPEHA